MILMEIFASIVLGYIIQDFVGWLSYLSVSRNKNVPIQLWNDFLLTIHYPLRQNVIVLMDWLRSFANDIWAMLGESLFELMAKFECGDRIVYSFMRSVRDNFAFVSYLIL